MISKLRNNLYISAARDVDQFAVESRGITAILNVSTRTANASVSNVQLIKLGFRDNALDAKLNGQPAIDKLKELLQAGNTVLIHCRQGKSRSPHVAAAALSDIEGKDYLEVYENIRELHPQTLWYSIGEEITDKY